SDCRPSSSLFPGETATPSPFPLSLHDALPISGSPQRERDGGQAAPWKAAGSPSSRAGCATVQPVLPAPSVLPIALVTTSRLGIRSEEHTSELQSRFDLVCRLLLEQKTNRPTNN